MRDDDDLLNWLDEHLQHEGLSTRQAPEIARSVIDALCARGLLSGEADATALASAEARAKRDGLKVAAMECDEMAARLRSISDDAAPGRFGIEMAAGAKAAEALAVVIRAMIDAGEG